MTMSELLKKSPLVRGAMIAPSVVVLVFAFFNLTATVDPTAALRSVSVGIVNQDEGVATPAGPPMRFGETMLAGLLRQMPFNAIAIPDAEAARIALDEGRIAAALVLPPDFTRSVAGNTPVRATVLNSDHLSQTETQLGRTLPGQLQAALSVMVVAARSEIAQRNATRAAVAAPMAFAETPVERADPTPQAPAPQAPPVTVAVDTLYPAPDAVTLAAPFVLSFAGWMAALIGSVLLFIGTRSQMRNAGGRLISVARVAVPVVATLFGGLMVALVYASVTGTWDNFLELWAYRWLVGAAVMATLTALFSLFGFAAFLAAVPLVFYQGIASGVLTPVAAVPGWIAWINEILPLPAMTTGLRTILIGGPAGSVPWAATTAMLAGALVLIVAGTTLYAKFVPARA